MSFISKLILFISTFSFFLVSCSDEPSVDLTHKEIVETPAEINTRAEDIIKGTLENILSNSKDLPDSFHFRNAGVMETLYEENNYRPLWSSNGTFILSADSILSLIDSSKLYGLFPEDYYHTKLKILKTQLLTDTSKEKKLDATQWAYGDMMLSSAFIQIIRDLKIGRLLPDSIIAKDSTLTPDFFGKEFQIIGKVSNDSFARRFEPIHADYWKIREALKLFLRTGNFEEHTYVASTDSLELRNLLYKRLAEEDSTINISASPDSVHLSTAIKNYQRKKKLKADGKVSADLIARLNNTDNEKFIRVAINLDRYKQLQPLPEQYIWVNIPGFYLQLRDKDTVPIVSKICVGKPNTQTPLITSAISDMITYPKWTIPESIVKKEILPGLKKDAGYTIKKGYSLVDKDGNEVDPYSINWAKYKEYIPYKVVQGSGDDNALGILKFNFPNKHSVYLHDTNQRYLFSRTNRALSHGCVRVQSWLELSKYILRNDSMFSAKATPIDSLDNWLTTKQKKYIPVRKPIPLFIRYFTCDVAKSQLVFYDDIYAEDKRFREKILSQKTFL